MEFDASALQLVRDGSVTVVVDDDGSPPLEQIASVVAGVTLCSGVERVDFEYEWPVVTVSLPVRRRRWRLFLWGVGAWWGRLVRRVSGG